MILAHKIALRTAGRRNRENPHQLWHNAIVASLLPGGDSSRSRSETSLMSSASEGTEGLLDAYDLLVAKASLGQTGLLDRIGAVDCADAERTQAMQQIHRDFLWIDGAGP